MKSQIIAFKMKLRRDGNQFEESKYEEEKKPFRRFKVTTIKNGLFKVQIRKYTSSNNRKWKKRQ